MWGYGGYYGPVNIRRISNSMMRNNRGQAGVAIQIVIFLATLAIGSLIFAGIGKEAKTQVQETYGNNSEEYQQFENMNKTGWSSLKMLAFAAFVSAAVTLIIILRRAAD